MQSVSLDERAGKDCRRAPSKAATHVQPLRRHSTASDVMPLPATLLERFASAGLDVDAVLRGAAIPRSRFDVAKPEGTTAEFFALWRAAEADGGAGIGLRVGLDGRAQHQSVAYLAALNSPTFGEGLAKLARYKRLVCPEHVAIDVGRGEARLHFEWLAADALPPPILIDCIFAGIVRLAQEGTGAPIRPRRVELARRRANEAMLGRHFGCDIRFDAPSDLLVFDEPALTLPLVTHDARLLAALVPALESALDQATHPRTLADDVRIALRRRICGERPAVEKIARALAMSPRTLQRRLGELGTSYQELLDEVRRRSARRLLASTDLRTAEVAFLLGFEELNSFTRAFHSWEGTTPVRWRATAR